MDLHTVNIVTGKKNHSLKLHPVAMTIQLSQVKHSYARQANILRGTMARRDIGALAKKQLLP